MGFNTRRLLAAPLLVLAAGGGLLVAAPAEAAGVAATVDVNSAPLKMRQSPTLASAVVGTLADNQKVTLACAVTGPSVRGPVRTTTQWDRLVNGAYVTHAYIRTGRTVPKCATTSPQAAPAKAKPKPKPATVTYKIGTVRSADGSVNVRTAPSTTAPVKRSLGNGATVQGVCGVVGTQVSGTVRTTTQWNRLTDGGYISHAYVVTPTLTLCPGASLTPPNTTPPITPEQFLAASVAGAQQGWREFGVPASVTIGQAILESGWGRSGLSTTDRNYFGIKCQSGKYGTLASGCHDYVTTECTAAGTCFSTTATFRTYATMGHSFRDHGNFLRVNSRYKPAFAYTKDANKFIWTVWKAGYATDPNYYTKITTLMASYNLYQYDTWK
ncbi:sporangiospore maturation cell wall hydrolase GsmA [Actinoplanes sp. NPDC026619]|uniref:sporangiospore maturation cell wall hydrolase GsmA n=1 Tax=Actinoplanes sp. NPDC026619 TaxID=3155798 RepID=UPI00340239F5